MKWHRWVACKPHLTTTKASICEFYSVQTSWVIFPPSPLWCLFCKRCSGTKSPGYYWRTYQFGLVSCLCVWLLLLLICSGWPRPSWTCWSSWPPRSPRSTRPPWKHRKRRTPWPRWRTSKSFVFVLPLNDVFSFSCHCNQPTTFRWGPAQAETPSSHHLC